MKTYDAEVAVVGLGSWGASALWRLAERGVDVIGFEAQTVAHPYGSSHGHTRLFRVACHEHVGLTPVARRARDLWLELSESANDDLLHQTGVLSVGPPAGRAIRTTAEAIEWAGLPVERLTIEEVRQRYPQHAGLPDHYVGLFDPEAGIVRVERALVAAVERARELGASVHEGVRVASVVRTKDGVALATADRTFRFRQVVLAGGPWMSVLQDVVPLTAFRAPLLWWEAANDPEDFAIGQFPAFIRHYDDEHTIWGHGSIDNTQVKLGLSEDVRSKIATHPDRLDRGLSPHRDWGAVTDVIRWAVPGLRATPVSAAPCMITESPDKQFVLGRHPEADGVVLAGGCSGHGFKHASAIGELISQIVTRERPFTDIGFMDPSRFAR